MSERREATQAAVEPKPAFFAEVDRTGAAVGGRAYELDRGRGSGGDPCKRTWDSTGQQELNGTWRCGI